MSNFSRKLRRRIAKAEGLPVGFYCKAMQTRMKKIDRQIRKINKLVEEQQASIANTDEFASELYNSDAHLPSEEIAPDGEKD